MVHNRVDGVAYLNYVDKGQEFEDFVTNAIISGGLPRSQCSDDATDLTGGVRDKVFVTLGEKLD